MKTVILFAFLILIQAYNTTDNSEAEIDALSYSLGWKPEFNGNVEIKGRNLAHKSTLFKTDSTAKCAT